MLVDEETKQTIYMLPILLQLIGDCFIRSFMTVINPKY